MNHHSQSPVPDPSNPPPGLGTNPAGPPPADQPPADLPSAKLSRPSAADIRRWRRYLADERAEAAVYRDLARRRMDEEREILLALADAEGRHEAHWVALLGDAVGKRKHATIRNRLVGFLARRFGSVFVLALAQLSESRSPYATDRDATSAMAADELIHEEVLRGLATRGRNRLSGSFRAAVFGANDGLVSNLALVLGIGATGVGSGFVLFSGIAGLLAGALSMGAGEYVSVRSQRELLDASEPTTATLVAAPDLNIDANELVLVYRARGMSIEDAEHRAAERLGIYSCDCKPGLSMPKSEVVTNRHESLGTGWSAAISSFCFFASGAIIPVLPYIFGLTGLAAIITAAVLVGLALLGTGGIVGLLSGASPLRRALRQLCIGFGAAAATYILGWLVGAAGIG